MGWGIWHVLGNIMNVYYVLVEKKNGNKDLEDVSVDVKIYKINIEELRNYV
jgi:hypothetical protein